MSAVEGRAHDVLLFESERIFPLEINELVLRHFAGQERPRDYRVAQVAAERITVTWRAEHHQGLASWRCGFGRRRYRLRITRCPARGEAAGASGACSILTTTGSTA